MSIPPTEAAAAVGPALVTLASLQKQITALQAQVTALTTRVVALEAAGEKVKVLQAQVDELKHQLRAASNT